jgi:UDP-2,3-diacylglucosamine pyrophosphatase LpxH
MNSKMNKTPTHDQVIAAFAAIRNKSEVARQLGVDARTVYNHVKRAEEEGNAPWLTPAAISPTMGLQKTTVQYDADGNPIQEWRRLVPQSADMEAFIDGLCERVEGKGKVAKKRTTKTDNDDLLAEIAMYDTHVGMYATKGETNDSDYDCDIASRRMIETAEGLASRFRKPGRAVVTFGGDILHSDNRSNQTEKSGNVLDVDSRYHRVVDYAVAACYDVVQIAASVAHQVDIVVVEGNHDWHSCVWLARVLRAFYAKCDNVNVVMQASDRKHIIHGDNLLVWSHGDGIAANQWQSVIATEFAPQWGKTKYRHLKMGHIHHKKKNTPTRVITQTQNGWEEQRGLLVEYLPALCSSDAWHAEKGFLGSIRAATGYEYHSTKGLVSRFYEHA